MDKDVATIIQQLKEIEQKIAEREGRPKTAKVKAKKKKEKKAEQGLKQSFMDSLDDVNTVPLKGSLVDPSFERENRVNTRDKASSGGGCCTLI